MPKGEIRSVLGKVAINAAALWAVAACTPVAESRHPQPLPMTGPAPGQGLDRLAAALMRVIPDTKVLAASASCGPAGTLVIRGVFPEQVLFTTASDQPTPDAAEALDLLAERIRRDAPQAELTVLGHTDAVGSDAYNMDLSRRRALHVLRGLVERGLAPAQLSAVAIGKRQPVAANDTPEGRMRNRRVEFLISGCLSANLGVVRAQASAGFKAGGPVDVMRLDPASPYGLSTIDRISLRSFDGGEPTPAVVAPARSGQPSALRPPARVARPAPAPHYQPRALSPDAQRNPLGPAVPF